LLLLLLLLCCCMPLRMRLFTNSYDEIVALAKRENIDIPKMPAELLDNRWDTVTRFALAFKTGASCVGNAHASATWVVRA
jgi:hypothetical protein